MSRASAEEWPAMYKASLINEPRVNDKEQMAGTYGASEGGADRDGAGTAVGRRQSGRESNFR